MEIIPLGHASFKLKGKNCSVIIDPYNPDLLGLKFPKHQTADAVLVTHQHQDHNFIKIVEPNSEKLVVFQAPGEYEIKDIFIIGIPTFHDHENGNKRGKNTVYKIDMDGISLVHLGDLGHKLTENQCDALDGVDVLFVPTGGIHTLDLNEAGEVISELEPKIVIPMHYQRQGEYFQELMPVGNFLKNLDQGETAPLEKLKVTKDSLPDKMQVVILE